MLNTGRILYSALRTPDGTLLTSKYTHDYVCHTDLNGEYYSIDGGLDYVIHTAHGDEHVITLFDTDSYEDIRLVFCRGGRGKDSRGPLSWVPLCDMSNAWLEATLLYCKERGSMKYYDLYEEELYYRKMNNIFIED